MPPGAQTAGPMAQYAEKQSFNVEDVIGSLGRFLDAALSSVAEIDGALKPPRRQPTPLPGRSRCLQAAARGIELFLASC